MTWTDRPDHVPCCAGRHGPVLAGELLARLLYSNAQGQLVGNIKLTDLFFKDGSTFCNDCGNADGLSVVRALYLTNDDIRFKAQNQANNKPDRHQQGANIGLVNSIRRIRLHDKPHLPVVRVYDDPSQGEPLHAVIRGDRTLERPDQQAVRAFLEQQLSYFAISP